MRTLAKALMAKPRIKTLRNGIVDVDENAAPHPLAVEAAEKIAADMVFLGVAILVGPPEAQELQYKRW